MRKSRPQEGIRGYGIAASEFARRAFPGERIADPFAELDARLGRARSDQMTITGPELADLSERFASTVVLEKCAMRTEPSTRGGDPFYRPASDLYRLVGRKARIVLFAPDATFVDDWFEGWSHDLPDATARRRPDGLLPYVTSWMDAEGRRCGADAPGARPTVPTQLRWWLTMANVLGHHTVNRLWPYEVGPAGRPPATGP